MKINNKKAQIVSSLLLSAILVLSSCNNAKITQILPKGNIDYSIKEGQDSINTAKNETAPSSRPKEDDNFYRPFYREMMYDNSGDAIRPSSLFTKRDLNFKYSDSVAVDYITSSVERISFLDHNSGFISFSHPPSDDYAKRANLPVSGVVGGTDIFSFNLTGSNEFVFDTLIGVGNGINTKFWDSHPFAVDTVIKGVKNTLLIWSSDRDTPYAKKITINKDSILIGNTDLFYAFARDNQWSAVKKFEAGINTNSNDETPSLSCLCYNPVLYFSSDRNANGRKMDYDLFSVSVNVDFASQTIAIASGASVESFAKNEDMKKDENENKEGFINSPFDDRFPFIPYPVYTTTQNPIQRYIYLSSNRFNTPLTIGKDSVIKSKGGYDLYKFKLPNTEKFACAPKEIFVEKPNYKLYLICKVNQVTINYKGDTISKEENVPNVALVLNGNPFSSNKFIQVDTNKNYTIERIVKNEKCESVYCSKIEITTPRYLPKTDTIYTTIDCITQEIPERFSNAKSISRGLAMYVTGYWWPLTSENFRVFKDKGKSDALKTSQFIDDQDYEYYDEVAKRNDAYLDSLYSQIETIVSSIDDCFDNQRIIITTHGFTDPCRLRATANDEFTKYSSDPTFTYNNMIIPEGMDMKNPKIKTVSGSEYQLTKPSENGNAMLSLLRSYYTKETIVKGFKAKYANNPDLVKRFDDLVQYKMDFFGVYGKFDDKGNFISNCPQLDRNIVGGDLPNKPSKPEECNIPHSRRVMVYVDVVSKEAYNNGFSRNECGDLNFAASKERKEIKKKAEAAIKQEKAIVEVKVPETKKENLAEKFADLEPAVKEKKEQSSCPGICYWVEYVSSPSEENVDFALNVLKLIGIEDAKKEQTEYGYVLISEYNPDKKFIEQKIADFNQIASSKLGMVFKDIKVKAKMRSTK